MAVLAAGCSGTAGRPCADSRGCTRRIACIELVRPTGFEPATFSFGGRHSNPLSYGRERGRIAGRESAGKIDQVTPREGSHLKPIRF